MDVELTPKVARLVGTPKAGSWSQVFWQEPQEEEIKALHGCLAAVVEIEANEEIEGASLGRDVFEILEKEYLGSGKGEILESLERALQKAKNHLDQILPQSQEVGVLAAALWDKVLYLSGFGKNNAFLVRQGKIQPVLGTVSQKEAGIEEKINLQTSSGFIQENDLVVLASSGFCGFISQEEIAQLAGQASEIEELADYLAPKIKSLEDSSKVAVLFLKIHFAQPTLAEELPTAEPVPTEEEIKAEEQPPTESPTEEPVPTEKPTPTQGSLATEEPIVTDDQTVDQESPRVNKTLIVYKRVKEVVREKVGQIFKPFLAIVNRLIGERKLYVRDWQAFRQKRKKIVLAALGILLLIFLGSLVFGIRQQKIADQKKKFEVTILQAQEKFDEAQSVFELNRTESRKLYQQAQDLVSNAKSFGLEKEKVLGLEVKVKDGLEKSLDVKTVSPSPFLDLSLVKEGFLQGKMVLYDARLVVWNQKAKSLLTVDLSNKSGQVVGGGDELAGANLIAFWGDFAFLVDPGGGVWQINVANQKKNKVIEKDDGWGEIVAAGSFLGNLYLLDRKNNQIFKYLPTEAGFSQRQDYLKGEVNLQNSRTMAIDGLIWVFKNDGTVDKFNQGVKENFSLEQSTEQLSLGSAIFTILDADNLYFADYEKKRVAVFNKEGAYQRQYQLENIEKIDGLVVLEKEKRAFVLSGKNLYSFEL